MSGKTILALNGGSSSLKFGLFDAQSDEVLPLCTGSVEGIGSDSGRFSIRGAQGETLKDERALIGDQREALRSAVQALDHLPFPSPVAVGHRIVHGGPKLRQHQRITPEVLRELEAAEPFAPLHVPAAVNMIRQAQQHFPGIPQFACFDTAPCPKQRRASRCRKGSGKRASAVTGFTDSLANPSCTLLKARFLTG